MIPYLIFPSHGRLHGVGTELEEGASDRAKREVRHCELRPREAAK